MNNERVLMKSTLNIELLNINKNDDKVLKNGINVELIDNNNENDDSDGLKIPSMDSYSRDLEICLEPPGITVWDDNELMCIQETVSVSSSSLESHELISEGNSSGYNSSGIDNILIKNKRDSDSFSASSKSESSELNCIVAALKATLDEFESVNNKKKFIKMNKQLQEQRDDDDDEDDDEEEEEEDERQQEQLKSPNRKVIVKCSKDKIYDPEDNIHFHEAVRNGDVKHLEELINNELIKNLDEPDWNVSGDPPLLVAATNLYLPVLSILLSNGCDPGVRSPRGETALHRVILNGNPGNILKFVKELLAYGCSPSVKEAGGGLTALHILTRQLANVHHLSTRNNLHNFDEARETFDILAKAGAVNDKDHQGRSALHILASSTNFDNNHRKEIESLVKILLDAGADTTLKNDRGETALHESLECGALITADILMPFTPKGLVSRYGETPLHIAARKNYIEIVKKLLENGENPSLQDARGNTPLHLASARGFHQIVSLLVTSPKILLEKLNSEGLTAIQVAAESGFINAVKLLLNAGADPTIVNNCNTLHHRHPDISTLIKHEIARRGQLAT